MPNELHEGGCQCGAVRFAADGAPRFVARCHCRSCRRATGAAFSTWVGFAEAQARWAGNPAFHASSPGVRRGFCRDCGTPLSYQGDKWASEIHILIGAFDEPAAFTPTNDAFPGEALSWCAPKKDQG
jgi:hypothetical protein